MLTLLTFPYFLHILSIIFLSKRFSVWSQLEMYKWMACGFCLFFFLRMLIRKNLTWFETFSHELTHIVVALLLFRKVHSFHAEEDSGVVYTSSSSQNGLIPMALAPYCLPIFTYLFLILRPLVAFNGLWVIDIMIGISVAFHMGCFRHQTGKYQTDINQYPLYFSYAYIYVARLINGCIIAVTFFPHYNVFTSAWRLLWAIYGNFIVFCGWILRKKYLWNILKFYRG